MSEQLTSSQPQVKPTLSAQHPPAHVSSSTYGIQPGQLGVIRRNGKVVAYDENKIFVAITKSFLAVEGNNAAASKRIHETVTSLTQYITQKFWEKMPTGGTIHIEDIQDQVELALMRPSEATKLNLQHSSEVLYRVARAYILYREDHRKARAANMPTSADATSSIQVILTNGQAVPLTSIPVDTIIAQACYELNEVHPEVIVAETKRNLFDKVPIADVRKAMIMSARTLIEQEPNHTYVAARLLLNELQCSALDFLNIPTDMTLNHLTQVYPETLPAYINKGITLELLEPRLSRFDMTKLGQALRPERDFQFTYLGLQTLFDRYFLHSNNIRFELPQIFFMRVAMGLAINEVDKEERTIEFYNALSTFDFMSSTPTLFNSGTLRPQLSSCYLTTVPDDLAGIYNAIKDNALLSKYAGGLGNDWTPVRAMGAHIKGTNGKSQGAVPFMKVANDTAVAVNQGGKRKGAVCAYLETWHLDIEEFLELRKNTGDERRRTHDMNTANWIPDLFMKRVEENKNWTLFSPDDTPDLHELYGQAFEAAYTAYEEQARTGKLTNTKTISANKLWRKMLSMLFETGHPWITFKDACNLRSPQQHCGVIHSSNLCTEITLNTSPDEIAVCNLGSINLINHLNDSGLDQTKLEKTINTAMRMLDNVIDINFYSVIQARRANLRHRPVGLGIMGFQDMLHKLGITYTSQQACDLADNAMELISYFAIKASTHLAQERSPYSSFEGSLWSKGILPIDSIRLLAENRGPYLEQDIHSTLDWDSLRKRVVTHGMRNSNVLAIAPTATISNICGLSQSIEPIYQNLYVKSNLSGEFTVINPYLVTELKALDIWDEVMVNDLKYFNGSVQNIDRIPDDIKARYATAFEIDPTWLIEAASRRQKWIDQAQSLNLYISAPSGKKLDALYRLAWKRGLKTTYYLRSMGATNVEKSTINNSTLNAVQTAPTLSVTQACSISDPDCEACQ